jgi:Cu+-exporting ATPase
MLFGNGTRYRLRSAELAAAIVKGAEAKKLSLAHVFDFSSTTGKGVKGTVSGKQVAVGNEELFRELSFDPGPLLDRAEVPRNEGQTVMLVAVDGRAAGLVAVSDPIKDSTLDAIRELKSAGLKIIMVTGDNATTAKAVADKLGIEFEAGYCLKGTQRSSKSISKRALWSQWLETV